MKTNQSNYTGLLFGAHLCNISLPQKNILQSFSNQNKWLKGTEYIIKLERRIISYLSNILEQSEEIRIRQLITNGEFVELEELLMQFETRFENYFIERILLACKSIHEIQQEIKERTHQQLNIDIIDQLSSLCEQRDLQNVYMLLTKIEISLNQAILKLKGKTWPIFLSICYKMGLRDRNKAEELWFDTMMEFIKKLRKNPTNTDNEPTVGYFRWWPQNIDNFSSLSSFFIMICSSRVKDFFRKKRFVIDNYDQIDDVEYIDNEEVSDNATKVKTALKKLRKICQAFFKAKYLETDAEKPLSHLEVAIITGYEKGAIDNAARPCLNDLKDVILQSTDVSDYVGSFLVRYSQKLEDISESDLDKENVLGRINNSYRCKFEIVNGELAYQSQSNTSVVNLIPIIRDFFKTPLGNEIHFLRAKKKDYLGIRPVVGVMIFLEGGEWEGLKI